MCIDIMQFYRRQFLLSFQLFQFSDLEAEIKGINPYLRRRGITFNAAMQQKWTILM
jgi:hypothetical protein